MALLMQNEQVVGGGNIDTASDVPYVNTTSGLTATDVQAAIDEIDGNVDTLDSSMSTANTNISNLQTMDSNILATIRENGAHNLFPITLAQLKAINTAGTWSSANYTINGVRFHVGTTNGLGYITYVQILRQEDSESNSTFYLKYGGNLNDYVGRILSGCPADGSNSTYSIQAKQLASPYTTYAQDTGDGAVIPSDATDVTSYIRIYVRPAFSSSAGTKNFYPMIRISKDPDTVFKAYSMTNRELNYLKSVDTGIAGVTAYMCGRIVTIYVNGSSNVAVSNTSSSATWITVGTLPSVLCPPIELRSVAYDNASSTNRTIACRITTGGVIGVVLFANETARPCFTMTYLATPY